MTYLRPPRSGVLVYGLQIDEIYARGGTLLKKTRRAHTHTHTHTHTHLRFCSRLLCCWLRDAAVLHMSCLCVATHGKPMSLYRWGEEEGDYCLGPKADSSMSSTAITTAEGKKKM
ncbi:hypothetical protein LY78DRAFT_390630 [Colletotrichum sublineola]|nr:hypothetical protein LY78DRAFT_390630 [Colletotrichum sublineola]